MSRLLDDRTHVRWAALLAAASLVLACSGSDVRGAGGAAGATTTVAPSTSAPAPATTTTTAAPNGWPALPDDGAARAVVTPTGVVLPVRADDGAGGFTVQTPCGGQATVRGTPISGAHVVLDPGHGGDERGATGANGLTEAEVNLAVAAEAAALLEATGARVVLTRTDDYRIALRTRSELAVRLGPSAFVSIHHNAEPDAAWPGPGSETYYQVSSAESKRLAGLVWEEEVTALARFPAEWVADTDAGAKYRLASDGGDYYGILRRTAGVPATLSEAAFISNPSEAALLALPEFRRAEARAIADAVIRFVTTDDPGSGFSEPYPRTQPAGPGGGVDGCVDPPLE